MKKVFFLVSMFFTTAGHVMAQSQHMSSSSTMGKKLTNGEVPNAVATAAQKDYPGGTIKNWLMVPYSEYQQEWATSKAGSTNSQYYEAMVKSNTYNGEALYDQYGKFIEMKKDVNDNAIPKSVQDAVNQKYKGWQMTKNKNDVFMDKKGKIDYYKVCIKNGTSQKNLMINPNGKVLNEEDAKM